MVYTGCGSEAKASCSCGVSYVPKKVRAAEAVAANPEKSNRAIAEDLNVDEWTVREARKSGAGDPAGDEIRTGRDGKSYPVNAHVGTDFGERVGHSRPSCAENPARFLNRSPTGLHCPKEHINGLSHLGA